MTIRLLTKTELAAINRKNSRFDLATAEKDYMLAVTIDIISKSAIAEKLVFKGGTAIHHCFIEQSRFSEDLDFTSIDKDLTADRVTEVFNKFDFYEIKEQYDTDKSIKINRLKYIGPLGLGNSIKIEIDKFQNVYLPPDKNTYKNIWTEDVFINTMNVSEVFAEKIRAASGRARYRDFYDMVLLYRKYNFDMGHVKNLIKHKEIRYPIGGKYAISNLDTALEEFKSERSNIYYSETVSEKEISELLEKMDFDIT